MIGYLNGRLLSKEPPLLWLDVGGVGYEIEAPSSTFFNLPAPGVEVVLHTHLTVREDAHILYGFSTPGEKTMFRELIRVSGIGPKSALAVLSGIGVQEFWTAVQTGDSARLTRLPGIGKKTVERLLIDLKDRAAATGAVGPAMAARASGGTTQQAVSALLNLGYRLAEAERLVRAAEGEGKSAEQLIRDALKGAHR